MRSLRLIAAVAAAMLLIFAPTSTQGPFKVQSAAAETQTFSETAAGFVAFTSTTYIAAHPDYLEALLARTGLTRATTRAIPQRPGSHFGCNQDVCINVVGTSNTVDTWTTQTFGNRGCLKAVFDLHASSPKDEPYHTVISNQVCSNGQDGVYNAVYGGLPKVFNSGTWLCNAWIPAVKGYPCAEVLK